MPVEILGEGAYRGFVENVAMSGREPIHIAKIQFPDKTVKRAYVKLYSEKSRGLVNEVTGHLLAEQLKLRVPDHAGIVLVPQKAIPSPPQWVLESEEDIPAWFTEDMVSPAIKFYFGLNDGSSMKALEPIRKELEKSKELVEVVAFDDWVANVDRHVGNLLRLSKGKYALIDHGMIFGSARWSVAQLTDSDRKFKNVLRELIGKKAAELPFQTQLIKCREGHGGVLEEASSSLWEWWKDLLDEDECQAAWDFLHNRSKCADLPHQCGLLI